MMKVIYADSIIDYGYFDTINKKLYRLCGGAIQLDNKDIISNIKITRKDIPDEVKCSSVRLAAKNIFFATGSSKLLEQSGKRLNDVVTILNENPFYILSVEGHTDNSITEGLGISNKVLTQKRALAIKNYLVSKAITEERIFTFGYGAVRPVASNKTARGRAQNRRVELIILSPYN
jgi:outer membrane protein OmpA-like peptidoglycan-associated protein